MDSIKKAVIRFIGAGIGKSLERVGYSDIEKEKRLKSRPFYLSSGKSRRIILFNS